MTRDEMLAYIAGLFDGEGCFGIYAYKSRPSRHPRALAKVTNTDKPALICVKEFLCVCGVKSNLYERSSSSRRLYELFIRERNSLLLLCKLLLPRLLIKSRQCQLVMSFTRLRLAEGRYGTIYLDEEHALMRASQAINQGADIEIEVLNAKNVDSGSDGPERPEGEVYRGLHHESRVGSSDSWDKKSPQKVNL